MTSCSSGLFEFADRFPFIRRAAVELLVPAETSLHVKLSTEDVLQTTVKILYIGDIFGRPGRKIVKDALPTLVKEYAVDLVLANGENAAAGFGITPQLADELLALGIAVLTSGNHIWDKKEIMPYLAEHPEGRLLRPANYPPQTPGHGLLVSKTRSDFHTRFLIFKVVSLCRLSTALFERRTNCSPDFRTPSKFESWICTRRRLPKKPLWAGIWMAG